jgi:hypothetical protein
MVVTLPVVHSLDSVGHTIIVHPQLENSILLVLLVLYMLLLISSTFFTIFSTLMGALLYYCSTPSPNKRSHGICDFLSIRQTSTVGVSHSTARYEIKVDTPDTFGTRHGAVRRFKSKTIEICVWKLLGNGVGLISTPK